MRLTLRTLLAYLDDRLSPANAREIGQKITNSPFATDLMERIRDVKRRRRLADPEKAAPTIDANLVAEYLDDQLTPELVARVEREILASDSMLAEVAAAHEILGLLRDPVNVEPRLRDRLYGLDPTGQLEVVRAISGEPSASPDSREPVVPWKPMKTPATASRRLPGIIVAVLALVWLIFVVSDSSLFKSDTGADSVAQVNDDKPAVAIEDAAANENPVVAEAKGQENVGPVNSEPASEIAVVANVPNPAAPKPPMTDAVVAKPPVPGPPVPAQPSAVVKNEALAKGKSGVVEAPPNPKTMPAEAVADELQQPASYYLQTEPRSVLLLDEMKQLWFQLADVPGGEGIEPEVNNIDCGPIVGLNWFGVTERFPLEVTAGLRGYKASLLGPCLVRFQPGAFSGLDLISGRIKLGVDFNVAWNDASRPIFILGTGAGLSRLELQTPQTRVAIEVLPLAAIPATPDEAAIAAAKITGLPFDADLHVRITVLEGVIGLQVPGQEEETTLANGQRAMWTMLEMKDVALFAVDGGEPLPAAPAWLFESDKVALPETLKQNEMLLTALSKSGEPGDCVLPLLDDRNPQVGILAVQILALTRDMDRLLTVLFEARDETVHRATIDGLSFIAGSSTTAQLAIRSSLETRVSKAEVDLMMPLLLGLTEAQAANPTVALELMGMLNSDRLAARTLAIYRMEQIAKDRRGYHPDGEASRRREAVRRWQRYLDQNSGRLLP